MIFSFFSFLICLSISTSFLIHPTVTNEMHLLQKCSKISKLKEPITKAEILNEAVLSREIQQICRGLPTLVQNVNYDDVSSMIFSSKWRLIYSTITPTIYKRYEYILNKYIKYIYIKKDDQSRVIMNCQLIRKNNKINLIYPDNALYVFKDGKSVDILPLFNIGTNSFEITYLSQKIRIQKTLHTQEYEVFYRIYK